MAKSKKKAYPRGKELLRQVVNKIIECPGEWGQSAWHCGTEHCVGGWSQILGGRPQDYGKARSDARELLGLSSEDADWLFAARRTLPEIHAFAAAFIAGEEFFDSAGYDRDGRDRAGYDRAGYDRDGFNRAGYDRDGYDRDGYDRAGKRLPLL